jgi:hypothetical protein
MEQRAMPEDLQAMLDAHVRYELERSEGDRFEQAVREEVDALYTWLGTVTVRDLTPNAETIAQVMARLPITDELVALIAEVIASGHRALLADESRIGDLLRREDVRTVNARLAGLEDARREVLDLVTTSEAYGRLVSHVVYHALKAYALTENLLARKIPGASSLVRFGQRSLSSAAPGLEANVDRQLTAFVQANISDTLRESRRFLDATLDAPMLAAMADEAWDGIAARSVASVAGAVSSDDLRALVVTLGPLARQLQQSGLVGDLVAAGVAAVLDRAPDRTAAALMDELGVDAGRVTEVAVDLVRPAARRAVETGCAEARIRARLEPFYRGWAAQR